MDIPIIILCGGKGTRIRDLTEDVPKPLIRIGKYPIIKHIIHSFTKYGFTEFILPLGYKGDKLKEYFLQHELLDNDFICKPDKVFYSEPFNDYSTYYCIDTGINTETASRITNVFKYVDDKKYFMVTYGDGIADIDLEALLKQHMLTDPECTITVVHPPGKYGVIEFDDNNNVRKFMEKPTGKEWINGGFMVFTTSKISQYFMNISDAHVSLERDILPKLTEFQVYKHEGFWQNMDNIREYELLQKYHTEGKF